MKGTCQRCGRPLTNKESIKRGYGGTCYKKVQVENAKAKAKLENEVVEINLVDELNQEEGEKDVNVM